jgi:hypothetical protein
VVVVVGVVGVGDAVAAAVAPVYERQPFVAWLERCDKRDTLEETSWVRWGIRLGDLVEHGRGVSGYCIFQWELGHWVERRSTNTTLLNPRILFPCRHQFLRTQGIRSQSRDYREWTGFRRR